MFVCVVSGSNFVTRKISRSVAKIHLSQLDCFSLGNLDSKRDWGHAKDYVEVHTLLICQNGVIPSTSIVFIHNNHSKMHYSNPNPHSNLNPNTKIVAFQQKE